MLEQRNPALNREIVDIVVKRDDAETLRLSDVGLGRLPGSAIRRQDLWLWGLRLRIFIGLGLRVGLAGVLLQIQWRNG